MVTGTTPAATSFRKRHTRNRRRRDGLAQGHADASTHIHLFWLRRISCAQGSARLSVPRSMAPAYSRIGRQPNARARARVASLSARARHQRGRLATRRRRHVTVLPTRCMTWPRAGWPAARAPQRKRTRALAAHRCMRQPCKPLTRSRAAAGRGRAPSHRARAPPTQPAPHDRPRRGGVAARLPFTWQQRRRAAQARAAAARRAALIPNPQRAHAEAPPHGATTCSARETPECWPIAQRIQQHFPWSRRRAPL